MVYYNSYMRVGRLSEIQAARYRWFGSSSQNGAPWGRLVEGIMGTYMGLGFLELRER